ncbi:hypothetical protein H9P43_008694 [Blastocladiella emersonii ATCC 22665]|nr:hypothetical protein H9P43_008694 [Blastocladiella emersonii ATCC 22665]
MKTLPSTPATEDLTHKPTLYTHLLAQTAALVEDQRNWVTNLANVSALVYHALRDRQLALGAAKPSINWVGFYIRDDVLMRGHPRLVLGPFQGKIACTLIPFGKGVCGAAAASQKTQLVKDVHAFPGHIACDSATNSEVVVPIVLPSGDVVGVLDLDCEVHGGFDEEDVQGLEAIVQLLVGACDWPAFAPKAAAGVAPPSAPATAVAAN